MQVASNSVVKLAFKLQSAGEVLDEAEDKDPLVYLHGVGTLPKGLEDAITGMSPGERKDVHLEPAVAFGERDPAKVEKVGRHRMGNKARFRVGDNLTLETGDGVKQATVTAMTPVTVTLDFNHPLAGVAIDVSIHVLDVRDSTDGERTHGHAHGWDGTEHAHDHSHDHDHEGHDHDHDHGAHDHDHGGHDHDHEGHDHDHDHDCAEDHDHAHDHDHGHD